VSARNHIAEEEIRMAQNSVINRGLKSVLALVIVGVSPALCAEGFFQELTSGKGGADPFNKNNHLGVVIKTPHFSRPHDSASTFDDPPSYSFHVNADGIVTRSMDGAPPQQLPGKAAFHENSNGTGYWQFMSIRVLAAPKYWDHAKITHLQAQAAAEKQLQAELQAREKSRQQILAMEKTINSTPFELLTGELRKLSDPQLIESKIRVATLIQFVKAENLATTTGFERMLVALTEEVARRSALAQQQTTPAVLVVMQEIQREPNEHFAGNLGIYYEQIRNPDGTFHAKITRQPAHKTPAGRLGFEPGDIIFELDGQRFHADDDLLDHQFQTEVGFIDVRSGDSKIYNVYIP
jgi:hypothetical protein